MSPYFRAAFSFRTGFRLCFRLLSGGFRFGFLPPALLLQKPLFFSGIGFRFLLPFFRPPFPLFHFYFRLAHALFRLYLPGFRICFRFPCVCFRPDPGRFRFCFRLCFDLLRPRFRFCLCLPGFRICLNAGQVEPFALVAFCLFCPGPAVGFFSLGGALYALLLGFGCGAFLCLLRRDGQRPNVDREQEHGSDPCPGIERPSERQGFARPLQHE